MIRNSKILAFFGIFLHSKIVSNSNRIFLDVRRVTYLSSRLSGTVDVYVHDYSTYKIFDSIRIFDSKTNRILAIVNGKTDSTATLIP
jgi:hypothetical protein